MRDLRAHAPDGRADDALLAERRRALRRRLPALPARSRSTTAGSRRARRSRRRSRSTAAARRRLARVAARLAQRRPRQPIASEPILRRLSESELAIVEAADLFNASQFRRTVGGIAKSLGSPRVSIIPLSGVDREIVVTVAWEISWYQYRVTLGSGHAGPARRARPRSRTSSTRSFIEWNAHMVDDGRIVPDIARLTRDASSLDYDMIYCVVPPGARRRAVRHSSSSYYSGQPERDGDHRPPRGARPPRSRAEAAAGDRGEARDARPPAPARHRDVSEDRHRPSDAQPRSRTSSAASGSTRRAARPSSRRCPRPASRSDRSRAPAPLTSIAPLPPRRRRGWTGGSCRRPSAARSSSASPSCCARRRRS